MTQMIKGFLDSVSFISENQAEYSILMDLYNTCPNKIFLFEIEELSVIKEYFNDVAKYINSNYKSFDMRRFVLEDDGNVWDEKLNEQGGSSLKDEDIINIALDLSQKDSSYILARTMNALVLLHNGHFDDKFKNVFADKQKIIEIEKQKKNIEELEWVFEEFHLQRKYKGCDYVVAGKISNTISEQQLRNHLIEFLEQRTKLHIVPELCTSKAEDEESVDIGVIDSNNRVAIIEVKYFVKQGCFSDCKKNAYSPGRFRDGYKQLDRYCIHLNQENYNLHSAFLYMFYAHTKSKEEIIDDAKNYLKEYMDLQGEEACSEKFRNHYKTTICDDMLDLRII